MRWKAKFSEQAAKMLRFTGYVFLAFDAIVLSAFTFWFVAKFVWHLAGWLDHKIFDGPWY
jgi:hypothetical protein